MKSILFTFGISLLLASCGSDSAEATSDKSDKSKDKKEQKNSSNSAVSDPEKVEVEFTRPETGTKDFYGAFFKVSYPEDFKASPDGPMHQYPESDKEYVQTDEARFLSPDGDVEFYIFSPQWGGATPYTDPFEGEKLVNSDTKEKETDIDGVITTTYLTFEGKDQSYTRAAVLIETDQTVKVFGVKFKNQEVYKLYKPEYLAFKKSLEQYAD